jgi:hypothetical protein
VLLFSSSDTVLQPGPILEQIKRFNDIGDVLSEDFFTNVMLLHEGGDSPVRRKALIDGLNATFPVGGKRWELDTVYRTTGVLPAAKVPSGPYFVCGGEVFQAWRIYVDEFSCFQTTVLPTRDRYQFRNLDSIGPNGTGMAVAVPSRLYSIASAEEPLAGVRIAIKDNLRLAGTKCSMGCRSFLATYDQDQETADYVKKLIDLGAVIVGKTKMTAFASSEKPCDWWDYQCPFNPRGDAHLTPGGSSTGSATAAGAYDWLDICVGSDSSFTRQ